MTAKFADAIPVPAKMKLVLLIFTDAVNNFSSERDNRRDVNALKRFGRNWTGSVTILIWSVTPAS